MIPGIDETLRINGTGEPDLLAQLAMAGKPPKLALCVTVREVFLHCDKSFRRARL